MSVMDLHCNPLQEAAEAGSERGSAVKVTAAFETIVFEDGAALQYAAKESHKFIQNAL